MPAEEITQTQAEALANLLHQLRPEWSTPSMMKLLGQHRASYDYGPLCRAAINVALDQSKRTPGIIFLDGRHWDAPDGEQSTTPPGPACEDHPTFEAHNCRCCWGDIKTGHRPETMLGKHWTPTEPAQETAA